MPSERSGKVLFTILAQMFPHYEGYKTPRTRPWRTVSLSPDKPLLTAETSPSFCTTKQIKTFRCTTKQIKTFRCNRYGCWRSLNRYDITAPKYRNSRRIQHVTVTYDVASKQNSSCVTMTPWVYCKRWHHMRNGWKSALNLEVCVCVCVRVCACARVCVCACVRACVYVHT